VYEDTETTTTTAAAAAAETSNSYLFETARLPTKQAEYGSEAFFYPFNLLCRKKRFLERLKK
jgi:hypothetical protein